MQLKIAEVILTDLSLNFQQKSVFKKIKNKKMLKHPETKRGSSPKWQTSVFSMSHAGSFGFVQQSLEIVWDFSHRTKKKKQKKIWIYSLNIFLKNALN